MARKKQELTAEEKLAAALVREEEQPYAVPGNWVWTYGKVIFKPMSSKKPTGEQFEYIDIDAIDNQLKQVSQPKTIETSEAPSRARRELKTDDVLFSLVRPYLENIAYIDDSLEHCIASTGFFVCRPTEIIIGKYLYYLMISEYAVKGLNAFMKGDNSPSIRKDDIEGFSYPLPPLAEQQRIVDRIESLFCQLDQAKALIQAALDSFENRKATILHQAFTGHLTKKWRAAHGVGMESWEECQFQDIIFETKLGIVRNLNEQSESFDYKYLKMNNIDKHGSIDFNNITKVNASKTEIGIYCLKYGDFLFNTRNSRELVGKNAIWKEFSQEIILFNNNIMRVRFTENVISDFISYYFNSIKGKADLDKIKKVTTNVAAIYAKDLKKIIVPLPSIAEQQEIVRILDDLLAKEQNAQDLCDQIDQIEAIKKTILGKAFRGELGTNAAGEASARALLQQLLSPPGQAN